MLDVVGKRKIYLSFAGLIVVTSLILVFALGLRPGIDLTGGTSWQVDFSEEVELGELREIFPRVSMAGDGSFIIRLPDISEEEHQAYVELLEREFGEFRELNFSSIGPTIGRELRNKAIWAVILVLVSISLFIAIAFRKVSEPIKSWKYGIIALITLLHDVAIPTGMLALLGHFQGIEIDTNFIVALLVVMGFSVHDTIVVFDRVRENITLHRGERTPLAEIINDSVRKTLARSVNTSLTLVFILLTLLFLGPASLFYFVLTILVGTLVGTYSSIFVASPLLYAWRGESNRT
jgi:preprotein translocase subunit SecF